MTPNPNLDKSAAATPGATLFQNSTATSKSLEIPTLSQVWRPRGFFSICHGSLLLPNRNLDGVYQRLELSANYCINVHSNTYANLQNLSYRLK